ncbi:MULTISPECIES: aminodeoxychorismate lyase [Bacillaceae]|uniref:Aminodeoxychorismate lyase n=1 Tax=Evansella alkalicola TaxID=745819 RepID=A0ABS6JTW1_9BACI|nr:MULTISPECIES: aminodeoxychorismate lyase [Bacillaceae]MBU9722021.1 aminodeoxychorismate lyase [Bacillus alkalicola]
MYLYMNGRIAHEDDIRVSPFDHGFLYGLGLFETFRTYNGHPFLLDDHFHRLRESAGMVNIQFPSFEREEILDTIKQLLNVNNLVDGYFRWNISAGDKGVGLYTDLYTEPNTIVYVKALPPNVDEKKGVILEQRRNTPEGQKRLKSHHYLNNVLGKREVGSNPNVEGIFLTEEGHVSEGVVSNIFWWKNKTLFTPSNEAGGLDGITKQFLITLAQKQQLGVEEGLYPVDELLQADEVFATNSIQEIVPLSSIEHRVFPGKKGVITKLLREEYAKRTSMLWSAKELKGE